MRLCGEKPILIDLDKEPELRGGTRGEYADKLIITTDAAIVVEEAKTIKLVRLRTASFNN